MSRFLRIFLIAYAAAMTACTVSLGKEIFSEPGATWFVLGYTTVSYLALALGYAVINDRDHAPGRIALAVVFVAALSLPLALRLGVDPVKANLPLSLTWISIPSYLACAGLLLRRLKGKQRRQEGTAWQAGILTALIAGAVLVLVSLAFKTTKDATGWSVIAFREAWITSEVNVATGILFGPEIPWLQPFYKPGGYLFYSLGLIATLAMLTRLLFSRMNLNHARESRLFVGCLLAINITCFWVLTDIFWGWHFEFSSYPVAAVIATALWLAGPLFAMLVVAPLLWKRNDLWRLRALLALQVPVAAFNMAMIGTYWATDLEMPGLGLLLIGLLLESLACIEVLASRAQGGATFHEIQQEYTAQSRSAAA